jgi:hypothetical protein
MQKKTAAKLWLGNFVLWRRIYSAWGGGGRGLLIKEEKSTPKG